MADKTITEQFAEQINAKLSEVDGLVKELKNDSVTKEDKVAIMARIEEVAKKADEAVARVSDSFKLPEKEEKEYSVSKFLHAAATGDWSKAGLEKEVHENILKSMNVDTPANGGYLAPNLLQPGIDLAAQSSCPILESVGISKINVQGAAALYMNKENAASNIYWTGSEEAGTESQPTVGQISLTPKYYRTYAYLSNELLKQTGEGVEAFIRGSLLRAERKGKERALIAGTSANGQPKGIVNFSNILTEAFGGTPTFDKLDNMIAAIEAVDLLEGNLAFVTHPAVAKVLRQLKDNNGQYYLQRKNNSGISEFVGHPFYTSTNMTATNGVYPMLFGDFSKVILATWGGLEIKVNDQAFTPWSKNQRVIGIFGCMDIGLTNESAMVKATGLKIK